MHNFINEPEYDLPIDIEEPSYESISFDTDEIDSFDYFNEPTLSDDCDTNESENRTDPVLEELKTRSLGAAGNCWSCGGTGVQWSGGQNVKCWSCGGSGVGAR